MNALIRSPLLLLVVVAAACEGELEQVRPPHVDGHGGLCADVRCDGPSPCRRAGVCNPDTGECEYPPLADGTACDDGNLCTDREVCKRGECGGGVAVLCRVSRACEVVGACDPLVGCTVQDAPDGVACDDGDACTHQDECMAGQCVGDVAQCPSGGACSVGRCSPATGECVEVPVADGTACEPAGEGVNLCQRGGCHAGACVVIDKQCPAIDDCHGEGVCDLATGECTAPALADGTPCDDGNVCTQGEHCVAGNCGQGSEVICPDGDNPCLMAGECVPGVGCVRELAPDGVPCNDGNQCTTRDVCRVGRCVGQEPVVCSALDSCHLPGVCDPASGLCTSPPKPEGADCDDNDACTEGTTCRFGQCQGGTPVVCRDAGACQLEPVCDPASGCLYADAADGSACDDGNACTLNDTCHSGVCTPGPEKTCPPWDHVCDMASCDPATGNCVHIPLGSNVPCDDNDPCTTSDACRDGECRGALLVCRPATCRRDPVCSSINGEAVCGGPLEADGTACDLDISDPCSEEAACVAGECISMVERLCPAIDACHGPGQCDSATGECTAPVAGVAGLCSGDLCFTDVTREMGWNIAPVGSQHGGSAGAVAIDYNGDNLTDILMVTESDSGAGMESRLLLLENQYSIFVDRTADARLSGYTGVTGVAVADFDNDGWTDIYVLRDGPNQLLRNRGASRDSSSAPVTFLAVARGVDDARRSRAAVFGDYNADGWLDLLVGNDAAFGSEQPAGTANALYRSEGSANFVDVAVSLNVAGAGATNDVLLTDLNKDGRIELLTCNDDALGPVGSALYTWRAGGFVSSTTAWRYASAGRCRSLAVGDYNGDGWLDVYMATTHQNKLLAGGATSFTDVTVDAEAEMSHDRCEPTEELPSWAAAFADLNADGRNEVLVVNGDHESDPCQAQPRSNALLVLQRDGTFDDVAPEAGLADSRPGRSVALLDFDNDGDLDLFVANAGAGSQLLRNERNSGGYLRLWLRGRLSNRDGIGTRLVSTGESSGLRQELEALPSTLSAGRLLLGAPDADTHTLEATWPSGVEQTVFQIPSEPFSTDELHRNPNDLPGYTLVEPRVTVAGIGALSLTGVSLTVPVKLVNHDGNADHAVDVLLEISANDWVRQVTGENLNVVVPAAASVGHEETTLITVELPLDEVDPVAAESFAVNLRITAQDVSAEATSDGLRGIDQHSQDMDIAGL